MTKNLDNEGFKSIINNYDLFFIDIWGVLHNGINLYQNSVNVLNELEKVLLIKNTLQNSDDGLLNNKTFLVTGKLNGISRAEVKSLIEENSGKNLLNHPQKYLTKKMVKARPRLPN